MHLTRARGYDARASTLFYCTLYMETLQSAPHGQRPAQFRFWALPIGRGACPRNQAGNSVTRRSRVHYESVVTTHRSPRIQNCQLGHPFDGRNSLRTIEATASRATRDGDPKVVVSSRVLIGPNQVTLYAENRCQREAVDHTPQRAVFPLPPLGW